MYNQRDQIIMLFCMGLKSDSQNEIKPLSTSEWSKLADKLQVRRVGPEVLLNMSDNDLLEFVDGDNNEFYRYKCLLGRGNNLSNELRILYEIGVGVITRADSKYPKLLKEKLKKNSPPLWFYVGELSILEEKGIAIVGSRETNDIDSLLATKLAEKVVHSNYVLISGGAKGVDSISEQAALDIGGKAISIISDSIVSRIKNKIIRENIMKGNLLIMSPFGYDKHFTVANAMTRNKFVYGLSEKTIVVKSTLETGGTWAGVTEAIKKEYSEILLVEDEKANSGNSVLSERFQLPVLKKDDILNNQKSLSEIVVNPNSQVKVDKPKKSRKSKVKDTPPDNLSLDLFEK
ncbi:MAG: DNA-processing protein DprA [Erysipelotrichaceae bacterium]